ncbi:hypothetical protein GY45DRAFT_1316463 [Cubamyces sp. BRFM 1775]|nr:hypothetical protein GY45DRAFT_1316463 [Cubamyces sp. BRFM 1775]
MHVGCLKHQCSSRFFSASSHRAPAAFRSPLAYARVGGLLMLAEFGATALLAWRRSGGLPRHIRT